MISEILECGLLFAAHDDQLIQSDYVVGNDSRNRVIQPRRISDQRWPHASLECYQRWGKRPAYCGFSRLNYYLNGLCADNGFDGVLIPDHSPEMTCPAPWHAGMAYALGWMRAVIGMIESGD